MIDAAIGTATETRAIVVRVGASGEKLALVRKANVTATFNMAPESAKSNPRRIQRRPRPKSPDEANLSPGRKPAVHT